MPRSDVFCFKLNFNISKLGYLLQKYINGTLSQLIYRKEKIAKSDESKDMLTEESK